MSRAALLLPGGSLAGAGPAETVFVVLRTRSRRRAMRFPAEYAERRPAILKGVLDAYAEIVEYAAPLSDPRWHECDDQVRDVFGAVEIVYAMADTTVFVLDSFLRNPTCFVVVSIAFEDTDEKACLARSLEAAAGGDAKAFWDTGDACDLGIAAFELLKACERVNLHAVRAGRRAVLFGRETAVGRDEIVAMLQSL